MVPRLRACGLVPLSTYQPILVHQNRLDREMSWAARLSMYPRKPLPHGEQLARLKTYLRRARTDLRRKYDEFFESTKGRRDCPLEVEVKHRAIEHAMNTVKLLEVCVQEVERQEAMFYAPFKPGDRIDVERLEGGAFDTYLVVDIRPDKKTKYVYECVALTKKGAMYKRGGSAWIRPRISSTIRASDAPLSPEGLRESEYFRRCAETSRLMSMHRGDLRLFETKKTLLGGSYYRRKDWLDPPPAEHGAA
jgi:hypothetical protein